MSEKNLELKKSHAPTQIVLADWLKAIIYACGKCDSLFLSFVLFFCFDLSSGVLVVGLRHVFFLKKIIN